jgi:hypothetical protein
VRKQAKDAQKNVNIPSGPGVQAIVPSVAPQNLPMIPPWFYGAMPLYPGYTAPSAYQGYPPAPFPNPPIPNLQPPNDPPLTEWLEKCDLGPCGIDGHNFKSYLPAFQENMMTRLSDIAWLSSPNDLINCTLAIEPKMPFGTASRLLDYAKSDYQ